MASRTVGSKDPVALGRSAASHRARASGASLFTSVVAFGVAAMAIAVGVLFILIGLGIRDVARRIRELTGRTPATT